MFSTAGILLQPQRAPNKGLSHVKINLQSVLSASELTWLVINTNPTQEYLGLLYNGSEESASL